MHNVLDLWVATLAVNPLVLDFKIPAESFNAGDKMTVPG